jgi:hypothetical protein
MQNPTDIMNEALEAANRAGIEYLLRNFNGQDFGACGFAWVTVYPEHKGNTREGKQERKILRQMGFELDWTGKAFQYWNPSNLGVQNIDSKHIGACEAAKVLKSYGFKACAGSRLD